MSSCTMWFYNPDQEAVTGSNFVNKIVAGVYPPFCHVELQFPNGEACSIVMNDTVRLRSRTFNADFYTSLQIHASLPAIDKALDLARRHVALKTPFGFSASSTFCSKLVAELLVESGIVCTSSLPDYHMLSPSTLYFRLQRLKGLIQHPSVPSPLSARVMPISFVNPVTEHTFVFRRLEAMEAMERVTGS
jgi:hypothetical protein